LSLVVSKKTAVDLLDMTFLVLSVLLGSLAYMPLPRPVPVPAVRSLRPAPAASRAAAGSVSMCGILAIVNSRKSADALRLQTLTLQRLVRHRGPDGSGIHVVEKHDEKGPLCSSLAHERLAIVDPLSGNQPLYSHDRKRSLAVNGEIYNHKALRKTLKDQTPFRTESDCEVIVHLYDEIGVDVASKLDGDFAFVLLDEKTGEIYAARDPIGVNSLYMGTGLDGSKWFASEAKPLVAAGCIDVSTFPPGHYYTSADGGKMVEYYKPDWRSVANAKEPLDLVKLRNTFIKAVDKRLMADVPFGVLLSGGLDSSLVASVIARIRRKKFLETGDPELLKPLKSFSIGLNGSPDLAAARKVADAIGTDHYGFTFTVQEGIDAVSDVIYHLETYDLTTIRAGTPMFLLARKIKAMGIKMVMSGEGADETLAGYLYFHKAPNGTELHEECVRKVADLHRYDCLRANKATMAHGLEARVPFLDNDMLDVTMRMNPDLKMRKKGAPTQFIEKWALRAAFDVEDDSYLPKEVLWRQKEQFSDGVGYSWIDGLKEHANKVISDADMATAALRFPYNTPRTKEGAYYRTIFHSHFPNNNYGLGIETTVPGGPSIACSTAKAIEWDAAWSDPSKQDNSGRMVDTHESAAP
jgi:asparagine synthase (glutamine-hydrolysing)